MRRGGRHIVPKLMNVRFELSFHSKQLRWHVKTVQDCKFLVTERTQDALSGKEIQKKKLKRAGESPDASGIHYTKSTGNVLRDQMLPTKSFSF